MLYFEQINSLCEVKATMKDKTPLAIRLKQLRNEKHVTQKELSIKTGISYGSIIDYENSRCEPSSKAMTALEEYFNVSGAYLRGETDDRDRPYWEDPDIISDLANIDEQMLPRLLKAYSGASEETKFYAHSVLSRLCNVLDDNDPDFQRRGAFLLQKLCVVAYDFALDCKQYSEDSPDKHHTLKGKRLLAITLMSRCLESIHKYYLPDDVLDISEEMISPGEQAP